MINILNPHNQGSSDFTHLSTIFFPLLVRECLHQIWTFSTCSKWENHGPIFLISPDMKTLFPCNENKNNRFSQKLHIQSLSTFLDWPRIPEWRYNKKTNMCFSFQNSVGMRLAIVKYIVFPVHVRLLTMCRGELPGVIALLMSNCLWIDWKW